MVSYSDSKIDIVNQAKSVLTEWGFPLLVGSGTKRIRYRFGPFVPGENSWMLENRSDADVVDESPEREGGNGF